MVRLLANNGLATTTALSVLLLQLTTMVPGGAADTPTSDLVVAQRSFTDKLTTNLYQNGQNECTSSLGVSMAFSLVYPSSIGPAREQFQDVFGYPQDSADPLVWNTATTQLVSIYQGQCLYGEVLPPGGDDGDEGFIDGGGDDADEAVDEGFIDGGGDDADEAVDEAVISVRQANCAAGEEPLVSIANSVWVRDDVALNASYAAAVGDLATQLNFGDEAAGGTLNSWVEDNTNGLIDSIVNDGPLPSDWILVAINAIYLKASWQWLFQARWTNQDDFFTSVQRNVKTDKQARFMHQIEYFDYSHTALPGYQVVRLPFSGDDQQTRGLSMMFVLPNNVQMDGSALEPITSEALRLQLSSLRSTKVALAIPRFKFESTYSDTLKTALQSIGLEAPFNGGLCVRDGSCGSAVDHVVQKTVIDVNEEGVEAAAVTLVAVAESAPPPEPPILFLCDHPFQFFIYDSNQDVFLFEGHVSNPGIPEGVPETAALQASHKDENFWKSNFYEEPVVVTTIVGGGDKLTDGTGEMTDGAGEMTDGVGETDGEDEDDMAGGGMTDVDEPDEDTNGATGTDQDDGSTTPDPDSVVQDDDSAACSVAAMALLLPLLALTFVF